MGDGSVIGYDLNDRYCQISFYNEELQEPQTLETATENYQIPLILNYCEKRWYYGKDAKRLEVRKKGYSVSGLLGKCLSQEKILIGKETYEPVWLLAKFIEMSLEPFEKIEAVTFSVPDMNVDIVKILKGIAQRMKVDKRHVYVQDYKESFCQYMFYQPKELWQYESALFYCDKRQVKAYMLRRLQPKITHAQEFVTVDKVASAKMRELEAVYPVLNVDKAKDADTCFLNFIESVFEKKLISSVYLTGEGFDNNWYPHSLRFLCNGRRAFIGNNLYSKGACYAAYRRYKEYTGGPIYMDDTKMTNQISIRVRAESEERWEPIVTWGSHWYESDGEWELIVDDSQEMEILIEPLSGGEKEILKVPLDIFPKRKNYSVRIQLKLLFMDEQTCKIIISDMGFGDFFVSSGYEIEQVIHLGGSNGQFNSLS